MHSNASIVVARGRFFYGLWASSSTVDAVVTLSSAFAAHSHVYLHSVSDVSLLSLDELDNLLSSGSFMVDYGHWIGFISWMSLTELVHSQGSHQVSVVPLINKCDLFKNK
jgi:hypothetical protein